MALIFSRLAHNFIKNGYYPTDEVTLGRVLNALHCGERPIRVLDPCCGEGTALAEVKHHLTNLGATVQSFGIEFDRERAWHAKRILDRAIHSDMHDVVVSPRSMSLLWLNPPYGQGIADKAETGEKAERLEMAFLRRTVPTLAIGGVVVLIVPHYIVKGELATYLAVNFRDLRCYMAPEEKFKQCVIFGVRTRAGHPPKAQLQAFDRLCAGDADVLPQEWTEQPYEVPAAAEEGDLRFHAVRLDPEQLADELVRFERSTLWPSFAMHFGQTSTQHRRPLRDLSQWHLALALAAGQVTGVVRSQHRTLLIKGDTLKAKDRTVTSETSADGSISSVVTMTDRFVPVIMAIEFTPGPNLGNVITIR